MELLHQTITTSQALFLAIITRARVYDVSNLTNHLKYARLMVLYQQ